MSFSTIGRYIFSIGAASALLAGCGVFPVSAPPGASNAVIGKGQSLLYVSDPQDGLVYMVALPSGKLVGKLTGFNYAGGDCTDESGDVFVANEGGGQVRAYKHGAKSAYRVLNDSSWEPIGCSWDPTTGNLAVCNVRISQDLGSIAVYYKAKGKPQYFQDSSVINFWYCSYDRAGDLFADATNYSSYNPIVVELPKNRSNIHPIKLSPAITGFPTPPLFWDGNYLAIAQPGSNVIYQYKVSGYVAKRVNSIKLDGADKVSGPFWVESDGSAQTLYAPTSKGSVESIGIYRYPSGGKRIATLYDAPLPFAATVSAAK